MEQVAALAAMALFGNKLLELVKRVRAKDWNGALTILVLWVIGVVVLAVCAHAGITRDLKVPTTDKLLWQLDIGSIVLLGMILTSTGAFGYDVTKSIDQHQTSAQPTLTTMSRGEPAPPM
jgi:hypothetical protein